MSDKVFCSTSGITLIFLRPRDDPGGARGRGLVSGRARPGVKFRKATAMDGKKPADQRPCSPQRAHPRAKAVN
jgi:hypothetical protein